MIIPIRSMAIAVCVNSFCVEIGDIHILQYFHVSGFLSLIPQHGFDFCFRAVIVSLTVPAERSVHHIIVYEDRLILPLCSGNMYSKNIFAIQLQNPHIII
jgi:hypothetical protein